MENILSQKEVLARVKEAYEKGFIVVPSKPNNEGVFKVPVWKGEIKEQVNKWNYEEFIKAIEKEKLGRFNFGVIAGKQKNGFYLNILDFDIDGFHKETTDKLIKAFQVIAGEDENKLNALLSGMEYTQNKRLHYFFLTSEPINPSVKKVISGKKYGKGGNIEDGFIELFTDNNRFVACYEGIVIDTDKMPVILRDLPVLSLEEANIILKSFGFTKKEKKEGKAKRKKKREESKMNNREIINKVKSIIPDLQELRAKGVFTGFDFDFLISAWLVDEGASDEEIKEVFKEFFGNEYDERATERLITRAKELENKRSIGTLIYILEQYKDDEVARKVLEVIKKKENTFNGFTIPEGFIMKDGHLYEEKGKKQKLLSPAFVVSEKLINENNNLTGFILKFEKEKIEISENSPEEIINGFKRLGFILDKDTARKLSQYITAFFVINRDKIKSEKLISRTGWSEGFSEFYLPQTTDYIFDDLAGFGAKGDKQKELELMKLLFEKKSHIAFGYCLGFASVLTHLVGSGNFSVFIQGFSGKGKTTIGAVGLSLFGDYQKLKNSLDRTDTGTEILLSKRLDVLNLLDEINTGRGDIVKELIKIIYNFEEGTGRVRAKKNLKLQEVKRFRGVLAFTSEMDFKTLMKKSERIVKGAFRRTFILDLGKYQKVSEDLADNIYKIISENHGNLISDFINYLRENKDKVIKKYEKAKAELKEQGFYLKGLERYFSVVLLATDLISDVYGIDTKAIKEELYKQIRISAEISTGEIYINREILRAKIFDFFFENKKHFEYAELDKYSIGEDGRIFPEYKLKKAEQLWGGYEEDKETKKHKFYFTGKGLEALSEYVGITKNELIDFLLEYKIAIPNPNRKSGDTKIKRVKKSFSFSEHSSINVYLIEIENEEQDLSELEALLKEEKQEGGLFTSTTEQPQAIEQKQTIEVNQGEMEEWKEIIYKKMKEKGFLSLAEMTEIRLKFDLNSDDVLSIVKLDNDKWVLKDEAGKEQPQEEKDNINREKLEKALIGLAELFKKDSKYLFVKIKDEMEKKYRVNVEWIKPYLVSNGSFYSLNPEKVGELKEIANKYEKPDLLNIQ